MRDYQIQQTKLNVFKAIATLFVSLAVGLPAIFAANPLQKNKEKPEGAAILWRDPGDISSRNLYYGRGSEERMPKAPFTFIAEDMNGSNPKFDVRDANDIKWKVKLGVEAQPETAVSHLLWAIGYFTDEDYYVPEFTVGGMKKLHRGNDMISKDGSIHGARFKRDNKGEKRSEEWKWDNNPFVGTKEFQGLKVAMILFNNWDIKDINNKIIRVTNKDEGTTELHYE